MREDTVDQQSLCQTVRLARDWVADVDVDVVTGDPTQMFTRLRDTDLVVVTARSDLDAVARAALYHACCPVVLARI